MSTITVIWSSSLFSGAGKKVEEKEEHKFDPLTAEGLKSEKGFAKLTKKHVKELEALRKKHQKERGVVQKTQCTAIEKLVKSKGK